MGIPRVHSETSSWPTLARISLIAVVILVIFIGALVTGRLALGRAEHSFTQSRRIHDGEGAAHELAAQVALGRALIAEYLVDRDPRDIEEHEAAGRLRDRDGAALATTFADDPAIRTELRRLAQVEPTLDARSSQFFRVARSGRSKRAYALAIETERLSNIEIAQTRLIVAETNSQSQAALASGSNRIHQVSRLMLALTVTGAILGALLTLLLIRIVGGALSRIRAGEQRFRTLVANIPGAVYRRADDEHWSLLFVSDTIADISGYEPESLVSGTFRQYADLIEPEQRDAVTEQIRAATWGDGAFSVRYAITHADGSTRWISDQGQIVHSNNGADRHLDGILTDITELVALEAEHERIERERRLSQKLEAVGQLAAGVAHEINTPLQFVSSSLNFLKDSFRDVRHLASTFEELVIETAAGRPDEQTVLARVETAKSEAAIEYLDRRVPVALERTEGGLKRVTTIVQAMREFGYSSPEKASADINDALRSTLIVAQNEYKHIGRIDTDFGELDPVFCNIGDLNQVFLNLIVNAAHAIEEKNGAGGELGCISVTTRQRQDVATIAIADDGAGIDDRNLERIFDPFFTTKRVGHGTGQGLAIARSMIVDKHSGQLTVESTLGRGTTFTIELPVDDPSLNVHAAA